MKKHKWYAKKLINMLNWYSVNFSLTMFGNEYLKCEIVNKNINPCRCKFDVPSVMGIMDSSIIRNVYPDLNKIDEFHFEKNEELGYTYNHRIKHYILEDLDLLMRKGMSLKFLIDMKKVKRVFRKDLNIINSIKINLYVGDGSEFSQERPLCSLENPDRFVNLETVNNTNIKKIEISTTEFHNRMSIGTKSGWW